MKTSILILSISALLSLTACVNSPINDQISITELVKLTEDNLYSDDCSNTNKLLRHAQLYSSPAAAYYVALCLQREPSTAHRYKTAISLLQYSAKNSYPDAMFQLSQTYSNGYGVEIDLLTALDWQRKFDALSRNKNTQPIMLVNGSDATKLPESKILESLEGKARAGDAEVQYLLAQAYEKGQWGSVDIERALHWYKTSAKNGGESASFILGYFYCRGTHVQKNKTLANQYLKDSNRNAYCN